MANPLLIVQVLVILFLGVLIVYPAVIILNLSLRDDSGAVLDASLRVLTELDDWTADAIQATLRTALVDGMGIKPKFAFGPLRVALSGRRVSPPLFESMEILGKESTLARVSALRMSL